MKTLKNIDLYLGYLGLIPFIFLTVCLTYNYDFSIFGNNSKAICSYGLVIASFLASTHWGRQMNLADPSKKLILTISSNINVIAIWLAYLSLDAKTFVFVLAIEFLVLLKIDYYIYKAKLTEYRYFFCIRLPITTIVVILLGISWSVI
ncbi:DUF3429 domain-containing protein [Francisella sp. LA112445]|uniref:DUF3429 domain-containing protein n=1 Tax=Francisella sp. LA112445 TaxID=1395624 RepID=UPI001788E29B|nr:DUF3429 domain-containing protein [Francisella sp. LA112445]QIW10866.1 DUF3429 domain-containing protein [Francisella sp. LA112445]